MAIVKTAASKATPVKGLAYILNPDKREAWGCQNLDSSCGPDPSALSEQIMDDQRLAGFGLKENERKYYHTKQSFHPDDRSENGGTLGVDKADKFAADFAERAWPGVPVVWAIQADGRCRHIHYLTSAVGEDGRKLHVNNTEYRRWKDLTQEMAKEYGLVDFDWREAVAEKRAAQKEGDLQVDEWDVLTFAEKGIREREGHPRKARVLKEGEAPTKYSWKDELRAIIGYAGKVSCSMEEFSAVLSFYGVTMPRNTENTISYLHPGHQKAVRGDTLGKACTAATIRAAIAFNNHKRKNRVEEKAYPSVDELLRRSEEEKKRQLRESEYWKRYRAIRDESWEGFVYGQRREFDAIRMATAAPREIYNSLCRTVVDAEGSVITIPPTGEQLRRAGYFEARDRANEATAPHREKLKEIRKYEHITRERQKIVKALIQAGAEDDVIQAALRNFEEAESEMQSFVNNPDRDPDGRRLKVAMWSLEQAKKRTEKYIAKLQDVELEESALMKIADAEYEEFERTGELQTENDIEEALAQERECDSRDAR